MNSIPLIKGNTPQEINTSIIALKKALSELEAQDRLLQGTDKDVQDKIKQINELIEGINTHLGTVDSHLTAIDGQITALQPVDTVASGNMQSVTSNAVADKISSLDVSSVGGSGKYISAISEANGKISATASDLATSATTGNANPITSGAVANILKNLVEQSNSLPTEANINVSGTFVRIYQGRKSANDLSHYPSLTNYSSEGGLPAWCLFHFQVDSGRIVQICTVQYCNTSTLWKNELFCRQKIDSTWFSWKSLHSLSN